MKTRTAEKGSGDARLYREPAPVQENILGEAASRRLYLVGLPFGRPRTRRYARSALAYEYGLLLSSLFDGGRRIELQIPIREGSRGSSACSPSRRSGERRPMRHLSSAVVRATSPRAALMVETRGSSSAWALL
jgi:hypothetical protein